MSTQIVILAAGQGKRMSSKLPKVLHRLAGKTMLEHVIATAKSVSAFKPIVIYGHQGDVLRKALEQVDVKWVEQAKQLGTGHALMQALPEVNEDDMVLVLSGDVPLITADTLKKLIAATPAKTIGMLTAQMDNPYGYGRIIRDAKKHIKRIVEEKDATQDEKQIKEMNPGVYFVPAKYLKQWLPKIKNTNAQQEHYLTDMIGMAVDENIPVHSVEPETIEEILGINDRIQLAHLERFYQRQTAEKLMLQGVTLLDPSRLDIRGNVTAEKDVIIDVNVILEGDIVLGEGCQIGANSVIRDSKLGASVLVKPNSVIEGADIGAECVIGPFARIRPGTKLADKVHIGNYVEIKNSQVGTASKINHLTYVGDSEIGKQVNIGAGTITCNYDGVNKHKTTIGDNAFIGSNTELVAPVNVGEGATIGAGSTITQDAPPHKLTLSRSQQQTIENWRRPTPADYNRGK